MEAFAFFVYAFTSIFIIVNPIGAMFTFMSLTTDRDHKERIKLGANICSDRVSFGNNICN